MKLRVAVGSLLALGCGLLPLPAAAAELTLEDRIAAQLAIERVYWERRIWPASNPGPKPDLATVLPESAVRAKVARTLRMSQALETYWDRPIEALQLQAELDRMIAQTHRPEVLRDLFAALDHDPFRIAECVARPTLADRHLRSAFAWDQSIHEPARLRAENELASLGSFDASAVSDGRWTERVYKRAQGDMTEEDAEGAVVLDELAWNNLTGKTPLPGSWGALEEGPDAFHARALIDARCDRIEMAVATWPKRSLDAWLDEFGADDAPEIDVPGGVRYSLPELPLTGCASDTWIPTSGATTPHERQDHSAVWTGTEMIVWGGASIDYATGYQSGSRYNPATDTWIPVSEIGAPSRRFGHAAIWTGTEMIVWGKSDVDNTGGRYNPITDTWTPTSLTNAPPPRFYARAVWTGSEMIVWGGLGMAAGQSVAVNTGGRYNPSTDTWTATSLIGAPSPRFFHTAVWTGSEMIVWGGFDNTGGRYNPATNTWTPTTTVGAPAGRYWHTAVWTGSTMIVYGGSVMGHGLNTGAIYDPAIDSWDATTTPSGGHFKLHTAVWTGSEMVVFRDYALRFNPVTMVWLTVPGGPEGRLRHSAVWTGTEMIVWGGVSTAETHALDSGSRYKPGIGWTPTPRESIPAPRTNATAIWTGAEMIVWGGTLTATPAGIYDPATATWTAAATLNGPSPRSDHSAIWTGVDMIVWGGTQGDSVSTGGRYNPATNAWSPTTTSGAPSRRNAHAAVWTGTEMIVYGGNGSSGASTSGGRYDPTTNSWRSVKSALSRDVTRAVWTGSRMIITGASSGIGSTHSSVYDPVTDEWAIASTAGAPKSSTAIWTGSELILWGDFQAASRYDPTANTWTPLSTSGAPRDRRRHTAVWTGREMIVWGGSPCCYATPTGGKYDPATDTWERTSLAGIHPAHRELHEAVWTGQEMIAWGGGNPSSGMGGRYCVCISTAYLDADGDGFGDPAQSIATPDCVTPPGHVVNDDDCDDGDPSVHPGVTEICDGVDQDCDQLSDEGFSRPIYPDADGDGYGDPAGMVESVCLLPGYVEIDLDCDDANPERNPATTEICNGIDDDCDAEVDEGLPLVFYADADGDGYGGGTPLFVCEQPPGTVTNATDCNDADPSVHPGAFDGCNHVDDDCDGLLDEGPSDIDQDHDGTGDFCDNCLGYFNPTQVDADQDDRGDPCDNCPQAANTNQADADGDSFGDACDNCVLLSNSQADFDADAVGDDCDNCSLVANGNQADQDADFEGDVCDLNDGLIVQFRIERDYIEWQTDSAYAAFNVYQGDLEVLRNTGTYTQAPGSNPLAERTCGIANPWTEDFDTPPSGAVQFSLITGISGGIEGSLGTDSSGAERPNIAPCP